MQLNDILKLHRIMYIQFKRRATRKDHWEKVLATDQSSGMLRSLSTFTQSFKSIFIWKS